jgi:hypothetical protein
MLKEYAEAGIERVTKTDIVESLERIMNFSDDDLLKLSKDRKSPVILKILARELLKARNGLRAAEFVLDRLQAATKNEVKQDASITTFIVPFNGRNYEIARKQNKINDTNAES